MRGGSGEIAREMLEKVASKSLVAKISDRTESQ